MTQSDHLSFPQAVPVRDEGPEGAGGKPRKKKVQHQTLELALKGQATHVYNFDHVFLPDACQAEIFDEIKPFVQTALDGENTCIFAYGQTGSGKTFTMEGPDSDNIFDE